jgi:hypothetical protein
MSTHLPTPVETVVVRFNEAFLSHRPDLLADLIADDCVLENTAPAPDGDRHVGREACLAVWNAIASDRNGRFDSEEVRVLGDHALLFWRYRWGEGPNDSVRGVNIMRVRGGRIVEARGYVKQVRQEAAA